MHTTTTPVRTLFSILLCCLLSLSCLMGTACLAQTMPASPANQLILPAVDYEIAFRWQGDTLNTQWEPHASLLVPVLLPHCSKVFYMQFDSGSPYSLFYRNKLKAIQQKYPKTFAAGDSLHTLRQFTFKAGSHTIVATEMVVKQYDTTGISWKKNSIEIIGTIGVDFFDTKTLVLNYAKQKLFIGAAIPAAIAAEVATSDFHYAGKRILLPVQIKGKKTILYFDTGSSAFELLTDKETCTRLAVPGAVATRYAVKSWDNVFMANTLPSRDSITIASQKLPLHHITYMEGVSDAQVKQMMQMGIGGMTGNKLFLNSVVILDTKNKKFAVMHFK